MTKKSQRNKTEKGSRPAVQNVFDNHGATVKPDDNI